MQFSFVSNLTVAYFLRYTCEYEGMLLLINEGKEKGVYEISEYTFIVSLI